MKTLVITVICFVVGFGIAAENREAMPYLIGAALYALVFIAALSLGKAAGTPIPTEMTKSEGQRPNLGNVEHSTSNAEHPTADGEDQGQKP